jgi:hypothetical protein
MCTTRPPAPSGDCPAAGAPPPLAAAWLGPQSPLAAAAAAAEGDDVGGAGATPKLKLAAKPRVARKCRPPPLLTA